MKIPKLVLPDSKLLLLFIASPFWVSLQVLDQVGHLLTVLSIDVLLQTPKLRCMRNRLPLVDTSCKQHCADWDTHGPAGDGRW